MNIFLTFFVKNVKIEIQIYIVNFKILKFNLLPLKIYLKIFFVNPLDTTFLFLFQP
jgi:hypothetical protein